MNTVDSHSVADAPMLDIDPFADEFLLDPYPQHERLREAGPVVRLTDYPVWAMARYEQVHAALTDHETFCSSRGVGLADFATEEPWRSPSLLLEADPPAHATFRKPMSRILSPRTMRETFQVEAQRLADELVAKREFDLITDVAEAYPLKVFPDAMGLPPEGRENLLPYGALAFNAFGPRNDHLAAAMADAPRLQEWASTSSQREALTPGGIGARIWELVDNEEITAEQAPLLVRSLLLAGVDTTVYGIANSLQALSRAPDQWALVHEDPSKAKFVLDEILRYESPVQTFFRTSTRAVDIAGVTIPEGAKVLLFLGAANRDPRRWGPDADRLDISRRAAGHVAFGFGIHQCVGQPLARLEAELILTALAQRIERIEPIAPAVPRLNNTLKGWSSAPVRVVPAS
jgi:4-methoxybenzoate monooxygenase (O-demethylating)